MKLASEGNIIIYPIIVIWILSLVASYFYSAYFIYMIVGFLTVLLIFCLNFFRDPIRIIPKQDNLILSPADGKIIKIEDIVDSKSGEKLKLISVNKEIINFQESIVIINSFF